MRSKTIHQTMCEIEMKALRFYIITLTFLFIVSCNEGHRVSNSSLDYNEESIATKV